MCAAMVGGVSTHAVPIYLPIVNGRDNTYGKTTGDDTEKKEDKNEL